MAGTPKKRASTDALKKALRELTEENEKLRLAASGGCTRCALFTWQSQVLNEHIVSLQAERDALRAVPSNELLRLIVNRSFAELHKLIKLKETIEKIP